MRLSASWCYSVLPLVYFKDNFYVCRKGGTRKGGWVNPKAWLYLGWTLERPWLALAPGPFLSILSVLLGPLFPAFKAHSRLAFPRF